VAARAGGPGVRRPGGNPRDRRASGGRGGPRRLDPHRAVRGRPARPGRLPLLRDPERSALRARGERDRDAAMTATTEKPARIVFGLLVLATFGAFFVTQKLKQAPRVVRTLSMTTLFSPNGDGRREIATIRFRLESRNDVVTVRVQDEDGDT